MTQITFPYEQVQAALDSLVEEPGYPTRYVNAKDSTDAAAVLVTPAYLDQVEGESEAWREHLQPKGDPDLPPAYRPYQHAPTAHEDRLLPIEPLEKSLAQAFFNKPVDELEEAERSQVRGAAILCVLRITLDPDDTGAVPILMHSHNAEDRDAPQRRMLWVMAYKTGVHGLYVRTTSNGFFGEQWGIVTGSGFRLADGWWSRKTADMAVAAIGLALPQVDWMELKDASSFTQEALAALKQIFKRYRNHGVDQMVDEPFPVIDHAPPGGEPPAAEQTTEAHANA